MEALRRQVEDVAVNRFLASGSSGIPVLTDFREPSEQLQVDVLVGVATDSSADAMDEYDRLFSELESTRDAVADNQTELDAKRAEATALQQAAEEEVLHLQQVEEQRLEDERVYLAFLAQQAEEARQREEQRQREEAEAAARAEAEYQAALARQAAEEQAAREAASAAEAAAAQDAADQAARAKRPMPQRLPPLPRPTRPTVRWRRHPRRRVAMRPTHPVPVPAMAVVPAVVPAEAAVVVAAAGSCARWPDRPPTTTAGATPAPAVAATRAST